MKTTIYDDLEVEKTSVAVDWLTITANVQERRKSILNKYLRHELALELMGEQRKRWRWHGYDGMQIGKIRWGTRADSDILILSGQDAAAFWRIYAPLCTNCTRVDLAVTALTYRCYPRLLHAYSAWLNIHGSSLANRTTRLERVDGVGVTLNVGSRDSDQFGRIYDKGAQLKRPLEVHRLWRYEVEFKRDRAGKVLGELLSAASQQELPAKIVGTVYVWFESRDLPPIFERRGQALSLEVSASVTSDSQKLTWLTRQVRPTVKRLTDGGHLEEVLAALGLS